MAAVGYPLPAPVRPLNGGLRLPLNGCFRQRNSETQKPKSSLFVRSPAVVALFGPALTRRAKKGKDEPTGVQKWFEEKKAEGTAGVGGAVIGGMLAGPLGAVVGSQVASKIGPVLNDALDALEGEETQESAESDDVKAEDSKRSAVKERTDRPLTDTKEPVPASPTTESKLESPSNDEPPQQAPPPQQAQGAQLGFSNELQHLRDSVAEKQKKLKAEIEDFYFKAEEALKAGDEASAREFLEARSKSQAALERMLEGEERRSQRQQEKLKALDEEAATLYRKAERSLEAGEDEMAREFLEARQKILQRREELQEWLLWLFSGGLYIVTWCDFVEWKSKGDKGCCCVLLKLVAVGLLD